MISSPPSCRPTSLLAKLASWTALALLALPSLGTAEAERELHDYAEVYVNQYFEPEEHLILSTEGGKRSKALANFSIGRSLEAKGRVVEAIDAYQRVLANDPSQHFLARKTAYLLARNGSVEEALDLLESNLENNPDQPFSHIAVSEFLNTYQGNEEAGRKRAIDIAEKAVERFPGTPAVYEHLVRLYTIQGRKEDALAVMQRALQTPNPDPQFWLRMGRISGRIWPAQENPSSPSVVNRIYENALDNARGDSEVIEAVADFFHATGQLDRALTAYTDVIAADPERIEAREKLAAVYGAKEDEERVISTLKEILEIDPDHEKTHRLLARLYMTKEDFLSAIPHLRRAITIGDGGPNEFGTLGRMMIREEQHEAAVELLTEAANMFPEIADFPFLATFSLGRLERWEEALPLFEKTVDLAGETNPEMLNESFYFRFAAAHERTGNIEKAEELFKKTIDMISKIDPESQDEEFTATVYNYLGYMWLENDLNIDEAGELIKTAAKLAPESGAIADSLGWFYFKKGQFEDALRELLRAEELVEEPDGVIYDHIAQAHRKLGDDDQAIQYMEKAIELEPENEDFQKRLEEYRKGPEAETPDAGEGDSPPKPAEDAGEAGKAA